MKKLQLTVLPQQAKFHQLTCAHPAFVGGFGSGKTETLCNQAIIDSMTHPSAIIAIYEPSYDLINTIITPRLIGKLEDNGIDYTLNKSEHTIKCHHPQFGAFWLRSLVNPERIRGYESYRAHIDEIDTLSFADAEDAWQLILGRNRQMLPVQNSFNRISAYSTPEGYNFMYEYWVKRTANDPELAQEYKMVKGRTEDNPHLPKGYIDNLKRSYPSALLQAYLHGDFVNLHQGTVYNEYDRTICNSKERVCMDDRLYVGLDFNVTNMSGVIAIRRGSTYHVVDELHGLYDTPAIIKEIKAKYPGHEIYTYQDASASQTHSTNASLNDLVLLRSAGFTVNVHRKNPLVKDRVIAVNSAFKSGKLYVNFNSCPRLAECLEQQAYDKNGKPDKGSNKDHLPDALGYFVINKLPLFHTMRNINMTVPYLT